ncbi:hypothetical protein N1851_014537 [Merluccius polli]|uniref:Uncharacterized protein n=1 Tax=Merluccius polli TaxID=89951 RepID=A0AA47MU10_MERPO|nr:hypothetical protein N1851_014537 [Merluccius polli]
MVKAYELVPEAYRQRFRNWRKNDKQTHVEFAQDTLIIGVRHLICKTQVYIRMIKGIAVRILDGSGALNTFVRASVLPFSPQSDTGSCAPILGMGLQTIYVLVHKIYLSSELVQEVVGKVGLHPERVEGVDILGNYLGGGSVSVDVPLPNVKKVSSKFQFRVTEGQMHHPWAFRRLVQ